jgi:hypothetical protein
MRAARAIPSPIDWLELLFGVATTELVLSPVDTRSKIENVMVASTKTVGLVMNVLSIWVVS